MTTQRFEQVPGLLQPFFKYDPNGSMALLIDKVVDEFLVDGSLPLIQEFYDAISRRFIGGRYVGNQNLVFNGLQIHQRPCGSVTATTQEYVYKIPPIEVPKKRRRKNQEKCSTAELTAYQALAGSLNFLRHGILPQAAFAAGYLQQAVGRVRVLDLINGNKVVSEIKALSPVFLFPTPSAPRTLRSRTPVKVAPHMGRQGIYTAYTCQQGV